MIPRREVSSIKVSQLGAFVQRFRASYIEDFIYASSATARTWWHPRVIRAPQGTDSMNRKERTEAVFLEDVNRTSQHPELCRPAVGISEIAFDSTITRVHRHRKDGRHPCEPRLWFLLPVDWCFASVAMASRSTGGPSSLVRSVYRSRRVFASILVCRTFYFEYRSNKSIG